MVSVIAQGANSEVSHSAQGSPALTQFGQGVGATASIARQRRVRGGS